MRVVTPSFKWSSVQNNNKINNKFPFILFQILGALGSGLGQPTFHPKMYLMAPRIPKQKPWFTFWPAFQN
jgi:hypothetical protein